MNVAADELNRGVDIALTIRRYQSLSCEKSSFSHLPRKWHCDLDPKENTLHLSPHEVKVAGSGAHMNVDIKRKQSFLLRLPLSIREQAGQIAHADGTSLNHFISLAVAEKLSRMDKESQSTGMARPVIQKKPGFVPGPFLSRPAFQ